MATKKAKDKEVKASKVKEKKVTKRTKAEAEPKTKKSKGRAKRDVEVDEAVEEVVTGRGRKKKAKDSDDMEGQFFDPTESINDDMDRIERQVQITTGLEDNAEPMSTGLLAMDLIMSGGIRPAWYTNAGGEQSCKTTTAITILMGSILAGVPLKSLFDYEGSTGNSQEYVESIARACGVKLSTQELFGLRDAKTGKWVHRPTIRYQAETVGEKFFDALAELLRTLPDKRLLGGKWWYRYEETTANKAKYSQYADPTMPKKYGKGIYIPAPDGKLQAIMLTDSYPAMNPSDNDEEEANNSLALQARMFSKHLPRVKGRLAAKRVAVVGINQIRAIPMARYGPTEQEPGGQALRFYSDVRIKHTSRALSGVPFGWPKPNPEQNGEELEKALDGGSDRYRYIHLKAIKNKLGRPQREAWLRLWVEDSSGEAKGFDPVWDTLWYLRVTGQLTGSNRNKLLLNLHKLGQARKVTNWMVLKRWILGTKAEMKEISADLGFKPMNLRTFCFKQMESGVAEALYVESKNSKAKSNDDDDED